VIEGVVYCLSPDTIRRIGRIAEAMPDASMRVGGLVAMILGVGLVWLVRH